MCTVYFAIDHLSIFRLSREACDEAFEKWREVAGIEFVETKNASKADIIISFGDLPEIFTNGKCLKILITGKTSVKRRRRESGTSGG